MTGNENEPREERLTSSLSRRMLIKAIEDIRPRMDIFCSTPRTRFDLVNNEFRLPTNLLQFRARKDSSES